jgi:hypothetical protein
MYLALFAVFHEFFMQLDIKKIDLHNSAGCARHMIELFLE